MNYKISKYALLVSIIIYSILTIFTARQIKTLKNNNINLNNYLEAMKFLGQEWETSTQLSNVETYVVKNIRKNEFHSNYNRKHIDNFNDLVEPERLSNRKNFIDKLLNNIKITKNNCVEALAYHKSLSDFISQNNSSNFLLFSLYLLLNFLIIIDLYLIYLFFKNNVALVNNPKNQIQKYSIQFLPEEYINDLDTLRKRLKQQKLSDKEIDTRITLSALGMLRGQVICNLQDLWLNKNRPQ